MKRQRLEYAVALGGGGTKGAYQVGVIKALKELRIPVKAVSGTSIGAINAAFMTQDDIEHLEKLYLNMKFSNVCKYEIEIDETKDLLDIKNLFNVIVEYIKNNGLDNSALKEMLQKNLNINKIYSSKRDMGLVTYSMKDKEVVRKFKNEINKDDFIDYVLASACFPIFKKQKIKNQEYIDGGVADVIPINMLIEKGYKNIIAVDIEGIGITQNIDTRDAYIKLIYPSEDLGGMFEFDKKRIKRNIEMGYLDTMRYFGKLQGSYYYFESRDFGNALKTLSGEAVYGLECAGKLYGIDNNKVYKFDEFLDKVMKKHNAIYKEYKNIDGVIDMKKLFQGKKISDYLDVKYGICLFIDAIKLRPTIMNMKIVEKNFAELLNGARAILEVQNEIKYL